MARLPDRGLAIRVNFLMISALKPHSDRLTSRPAPIFPGCACRWVGDLQRNSAVAVSVVTTSACLFRVCNREKNMSDMMANYGWLGWIVVGGLAGLIAKAIMPGRDP